MNNLIINNYKFKMFSFLNSIQKPKSKEEDIIPTLCQQIPKVLLQMIIDYADDSLYLTHQEARDQVIAYREEHKDELIELIFDSKDKDVALYHFIQTVIPDHETKPLLSLLCETINLKIVDRIVANCAMSLHLKPMRFAFTDITNYLIENLWFSLRNMLFECIINTDAARKFCNYIEGTTHMRVTLFIPLGGIRYILLNDICMPKYNILVDRRKECFIDKSTQFQSLRDNRLGHIPIHHRVYILPLDHFHNSIEMKWLHIAYQDNYTDTRVVYTRKKKYNIKSYQQLLYCMGQLQAPNQSFYQFLLTWSNQHKNQKKSWFS